MKIALRDRDGNQDIEELTRFIAFIKERGIKRYLEIGCRNGDSFYAVMKAIGPGGFGLAIDKPESDGTRANLAETVRELNAEGIECQAHWGDSTDEAVIKVAWYEYPFDLVLIDGDHSLEGVTADWKNYAGLAPIVALHDVTAPDDHWSDGKINSVGLFWRTLDAPGERIEIVTPGSKMGFGIVDRTRLR